MRTRRQAIRRLVLLLIGSVILTLSMPFVIAMTIVVVRKIRGASDFDLGDSFDALFTGIHAAPFVLLLGSLIAWYDWQRWRWTSHGHCKHCGYDLRGDPSAERCPECGHEV